MLKNLMNSVSKTILRARQIIKIMLILNNYSDIYMPNKKETYVCKEDKSFFVKFWTEDEWSKTATMTFLFILENL